MGTNDLSKIDKTYHLHSYTNAVKHQTVEPCIITKGEGIYVFDHTGKKYIEGMAGLWSVAVGFNEQRIIDTVTKQMQELPFYHTFTHKSNIPSIKLAQKLVQLTDGLMSQAYFTNSGSEANDTIVKMVWYYHNAIGKPNKKKIISRVSGYHGVTVASGSLTGLAPNHKDFDLPIDRILHTSSPHFYRNGLPGETEEEFATRLANELEELILSEGPDTIGAFIGEPIMGAGGVIVPPKTYWEKIQQVCRKYDILVAADEVITGFGRTGHMFASNYFGIKPDFMTLSKQLTSSYLPLAAVLLNDKVADAIANHSGTLGSFGHGYTASGHPVCTAVGLENLAIIEENNLVGNAVTSGEILQDRLRKLVDHPLVGEVRGLGLIAGVELVANKATKEKFDPVGSVGALVSQIAQEKGLIIRGIQDTLAFCPPLVITPEEVNNMVDIFEAALNEVTAQLD